jgi:hypothetical protein
VPCAAGEAAELDADRLEQTQAPVVVAYRPVGGFEGVPDNPERLLVPEGYTARETVGAYAEPERNPPAAGAHTVAIHRLANPLAARARAEALLRLECGVADPLSASCRVGDATDLGRYDGYVAEQAPAAALVDAAVAAHNRDRDRDRCPRRVEFHPAIHSVELQVRLIVTSL